MFNIILTNNPHQHSSPKVKHNVRVVSIALGAKASTSLEVANRIMVMIIMIINSFDIVNELDFLDLRT